VLRAKTNTSQQAEAFHLIEDLAAMRVPALALTGGDPLRRPGMFPILEFAAGCGDEASTENWSKSASNQARRHVSV